MAIQMLGGLSKFWGTDGRPSFARVVLPCLETLCPKLPTAPPQTNMEPEPGHYVSPHTRHVTPLNSLALLQRLNLGEGTWPYGNGSMI